MEIGTVETIPESESEKRKGLSRGGSRQGGGGSGGKRPPGGGGDGPDNFNSDYDDDQKSVYSTTARNRILTFFLLLVVMMTFGGLIAAYVVVATNNVAEWQPFALPIPVWISTVVIILSSVVYFFAERSVQANEQDKAKRFLLITTALGAVFISSQIMAWLVLTQRGLYVYGNPYAGFFYILTAVHAVHVIGGITALSTILLKSWQPARNEDEVSRRASLATVVGWYWHFTGLLWLIIFVLLGFWK